MLEGLSGRPNHAGLHEARRECGRFGSGFKSGCEWGNKARKAPGLEPPGAFQSPVGR